MGVVYETDGVRKYSLVEAMLHTYPKVFRAVPPGRERGHVVLVKADVRQIRLVKKSYSQCPICPSLHSKVPHKPAPRTWPILLAS